MKLASLYHLMLITLAPLGTSELIVASQVPITKGSVQALPYELTLHVLTSEKKGITIEDEHILTFPRSHTSQLINILKVEAITDDEPYAISQSTFEALQKIQLAPQHQETIRGDQSAKSCKPDQKTSMTHEADKGPARKVDNATVAKSPTAPKSTMRTIAPSKSFFLNRYVRMIGSMLIAVGVIYGEYHWCTTY